MFFGLLLGCSVAFAVDCDPCEPLADVSITNKGLEKIIQISMQENFKRLNETVKSRAQFKNIVIDRSKCEKRTMEEAWKNRNTDGNCFGLPQLDDDFIGSDTVLRPYRAEVGGLTLKDMAIELAGPVKCEKFKCDFDVSVKNLNVDGNLKVDYTDKKEAFIPSTDFSITSTKDKNLKFSGQVIIDPQTGKLNDLIFLNEEKSKIKIDPGSLNIDLKLIKPFASKDVERKMRANAYRRMINTKKINAEYIDQQYQQAVQNFKSDLQSVEPAADSKEEFDLSEKSVREKVIAKFGSEAAFKKRLQNIQWPSPDNDAEIETFLKDPPAEILFLPEVSKRVDLIDLAAHAENAGFTNDRAYLLTLVGGSLTNLAGTVPSVVDGVIEPLLQREIVPVVQAEVNAELRAAKDYWNEISSVPDLNFADLEKMFVLQKKLADTKGETERQKLRRDIIELTKKMQDSWVPIDTQVLVDQNTRAGSLLKAQVFKSTESCSDLPKRFSNDDDVNPDFDLRTEVGPVALQHYFNELAAKKKLELCMDSTDSKNCSGGTKINFTTPPKISCENGELAIEFDINAARKIFNADVAGKVRAQVKNCNGDPCLQFTDSKGRFKNTLLNTFFGGFLQRGLSGALNQSNNMPINIPFVQLQKLQTTKSDCKTKLDWQIRP